MSIYTSHFMCLLNKSILNRAFCDNLCVTRNFTFSQAHHFNKVFCDNSIQWQNSRFDFKNGFYVKITLVRSFSSNIWVYTWWGPKHLVHLAPALVSTICQNVYGTVLYMAYSVSVLLYLRWWACYSAALLSFSLKSRKWNQNVLDVVSGLPCQLFRTNSKRSLLSTSCFSRGHLRASAKVNHTEQRHM